MERDFEREKIERKMINEIACRLDKIIRRKFGERKAFALIVFSDDQRAEGSYVSNATFEQAEPAIHNTLRRVAGNKARSQ